MDALLAATYAYDGAKRPTSVTKVGSAAATFTETYDRDGNVTSEGRTLAGVTGDAGSGTQAFSYDGLARVTAGAGLATTLAYSYDRDGNRLTRTAAGSTTTYSYDRTGALISRVDGGTTTYDAYDGYGTLTSYASAVNQVTTLTVDLGDRVTSVTRPGGGNATTSFTLDALGRVASRTLPGAPLETISYLGTSDTVSVLASSAGTTSSALDPAGQRVANAAGGSTGFLLADLHGNQGAVVNASESALTSASRYDPFGATAATWDSGSGVPTPWRFQGRWDLLADQTDPLYAAGARAYLPATATFTSLDSYPGSVANPTSLNRYLYAAANPWTLIDPSGHYAMAGDEPTAADIDLQDTSQTADAQVAHCVSTLTCSQQVIESWSAHNRVDWLQQFDNTYGANWGFSGWFNNVQGIVAFAGERDLLGPGSWFSVVDSYILAAIQSGLAVTMGKVPPPETPNLGIRLWASFFRTALRPTSLRRNDDLRTLWGQAEQAATNYGLDRARKLGLEGTPAARGTLLAAGNLYRFAVAHPSETRLLGGIAGVTQSAAGCGAILILYCATLGARAAFEDGAQWASDLTDPRSFASHDIAVRLYDNWWAISLLFPEIAFLE